jgi:hypothetical protein
MCHGLCKALGYGLDGGGSRVRVPVGAGNFSPHRCVQLLRPTHPPIQCVPGALSLGLKLIVTQLIKKYPAFFMEPEGSSPCSQKPATGPYPEPKYQSKSESEAP